MYSYFEDLYSFSLLSGLLLITISAVPKFLILRRLTIPIFMCKFQSICNLYFYSLLCGYCKSSPIQICTFLQPILSDKIVILFLMRFCDAANTNFNHIFFEISYLSFLKQVQPREIIVKLWKETLSL